MYDSKWKISYKMVSCLGQLYIKSPKTKLYVIGLKNMLMLKHGGESSISSLHVITQIWACSVENIFYNYLILNTCITQWRRADKDIIS